MKNRGPIAWTLLVIVLAGIVFAAWYRSAAGTADALTTTVLASVDGRDLTVGRFNESFVQHLLATGRNDTPEERYRHLDGLLRDMILAGEARRLGLDRSPEFESHVDRSRRLAVGAQWYDEEFVRTRRPLTEAEVREAFEKSRTRVAIRHLFFRDPEAAKAAWNALEAGFDFVDLARDLYGTTPDDSAAGYLGFATYWDLDDAVAEAAYELPVGQYSEPIRSRYGWHILRVEERLRSPILTETDFTMHRAGVEGRAFIRSNRISGDEFIREMMEGLDVRVDEAGARLLVDAMTEAVARPDPADAQGEAAQRARLQVTSDEIEILRRRLEPGTVLTTLNLDGKRAEFTAGDFIRWLPELPYEEVRDRTISAVGRALRNEILAYRGTEAGLEDRPLVREAVRFASDSWLAAGMREVLRVSGRVVPTDTEIAEAFERLGYRKLESATADGWVATFPSFAEAKAALADVLAGANPATLASFTTITDEDIKGGGIAGHVRRAPLNRPVAGCASEAECFVLNVQRRELSYTRLEDRKEEIRQVLISLLPEERMADSLMAVSAVRVDTLLFRTLMEPKPGSRS